MALRRLDLAPRWRFARSTHERVAAGVAGGLAETTGIDPYLLRIALVVTTLAGGIGVVVYAAAAALSTEPSSSATDDGTRRRASGIDGTQPVIGRRNAALVCATGAVLVWARSIGLWPGDSLMVPALAVAVASGLVWWRAGQGTSGVDPFEKLLSGRTGPLRLAAGLVLGLVGLVALTGTGSVRSTPRAAAALVLAVGGVIVVAGPFVGRLMQQVGEEQRHRIRTEERAEVAAHLHDSVLQTLALMQRANDDPRRMTVLARRQERELRAWLYGGRAGPATGTVAGDAEAMIAELEFDHGIGIDLVVVGDAPADARTGALLGAAREAVVNAAKHAGIDQVSVYVEVEPEQLVAYVRDTGCGFEPGGTADAEGERVGIAESIVGRLARVRGTAALDSAVGAGTEWELRVPR